MDWRAKLSSLYIHSMMPSHCCEMSLICTFKKLASAHKIQTLVSRFPPSHTLCEQLSISNDPQSQHNHNMDCRQYAEEEAITGCRRDKAKIFSTVRGRRSFPHHHTWLLPLSPCCEDQERGDQIKTLDLHQCSGQDWPKHWIHNPLLIVYSWWYSLCHPSLLLGAGGDSLLALWRVSNNVNCWSILLFQRNLFYHHHNSRHWTTQHHQHRYPQFCSIRARRCRQHGGWRLEEGTPSKYTMCTAVPWNTADYIALQCILVIV